MSVFEIAGLIGAVSLILGTIIAVYKKLSKPIKVLLDIRDAVKTLYGKAFVDDAQKIIDTGSVTDSDYVHLQKKYKLYVEKLGGDKNGLPRRKMDDIEDMHKNRNIKTEVPGMVQNTPQHIEKLNILVVDDDTLTHNVISHALSTDYKITAIKDPLKAESILLNNRPQLIILDYNMPQMTGIELAQLIRDMPTHRRTPIIMLTGKKDSETLGEALTHGIDEYVTKPFDIEEFKKIVKKFTQH